MRWAYLKVGLSDLFRVFYPNIHSYLWFNSLSLLPWIWLWYLGNNSYTFRNE